MNQPRQTGFFLGISSSVKKSLALVQLLGITSWVLFSNPGVSPAVMMMDTTPPTASILSPANGASVSGTLSVMASASDNMGVTKIEIYLDGALKSTGTTSPYSYSWNTPAVTSGSHTLIAKAYDAANNVGTSASVMVTVSNDTTPPTVSINSPAGGATVSGTVAIMASASANVGVNSVEFYVDSTLKSTCTLSPYTYSWDTNGAAAGSHTLQAKAYDAANNVGTSASVTVTAVVDNTAPTLTITEVVSSLFSCWLYPLILTYYADTNGDGNADGSTPAVPTRALNFADVVALGQALLELMQEYTAYPPESVLPIMKYKALHRWQTQLSNYMATGNAALLTPAMMSELTALRNRLNTDYTAAVAALAAYDADTAAGINDGSQRATWLAKRVDAQRDQSCMNGLFDGIQATQANGWPAAAWVATEQARFQSLMTIRTQCQTLITQMRAAGDPTTAAFRALETQMQERRQEFQDIRRQSETSLTARLAVPGLSLAERQVAQMMYNMSWVSSVSFSIATTLSVWNTTWKNLLDQFFGTNPLP